jgi:hypothetical protein
MGRQKSEVMGLGVHSGAQLYMRVRRQGDDSFP